MQRTWSLFRTLIFPGLLTAGLIAGAVVVEQHTQYRFNWPNVMTVLLGAGAAYTGLVVSIHARTPVGEFFPEDEGFTLVFQPAAWRPCQHYEFTPQDNGWAVRPGLSDSAQNWLEETKADLTLSPEPQPEDETHADDVDEAEARKPTATETEQHDAETNDTGPAFEQIVPQDIRCLEPGSKTDEPIDVDDEKLSNTDRATLIVTGSELSSDESETLNELIDEPGEWTVEPGEEEGELQAVFEQNDQPVFTRRFMPDHFDDPLGAAHEFITAQRSTTE